MSPTYCGKQNPAEIAAYPEHSATSKRWSTLEIFVGGVHACAPENHRFDSIFQVKAPLVHTLQHCSTGSNSVTLHSEVSLWFEGERVYLEGAYLPPPCGSDNLHGEGCQGRNGVTGAIHLHTKQCQNPEQHPQGVHHETKAGVEAAERDGERSILAEIIASCRTQPRPLADDLGRRCKARSHPPFTAASPTTMGECLVMDDVEDPKEWLNREETRGSYFIAVLRSLMKLVTANISSPKMATFKRTGDELVVDPSAAAIMDTAKTGLAPMTYEGGLAWGEGDRDSRRKRLLNGAMKLLLELIEDQAQARRGVGRECNDLMWDAVVVVLSDRWSDIRKIGATYARSLAAAVEPGEAWALCLKCATACNHALSVSGREERDSWKSLHGFLLGMRSAVEGARGALGSSTETPYGSDCAREESLENADRRAIQQVATPSGLVEGSNRERGGQLISIDLANAFGRPVAWDRNQSAGLSTNVVSLPYHKERRCGREAVHACEREECLRAEGTNRASSPLLSSSPGPPSEAPPSPPPPPPSLRPPPPPPSLRGTKPHPWLLSLAFACLAHRQATVREAAIGVLCSMVVLRPCLARNLYEKAIDDLERLEGDSHEAGDRAVTGGAAGERRKSTGKSSSPQANTWRKDDRARGILCLLEQLVHSLPPGGTIGVTYERLFSVLRFYFGHLDTALRQAATAVVLRIAKTMDPPDGRGHAVDSYYNNHTELPPAPQKRKLCDADDRHQYARVVLWMLVRSWREQARGCVAPPATTSPGNVRASISFGHHGKECLIASKRGRSSPIGAGWNTPDDKKTPASWVIRESVLMAYEGVLKSLVERVMCDIVSGGGGGGGGGNGYNRTDSGRAPFTEATVDTAVDEDGAHRDHVISFGGESAKVIEATPSLKEILVSIEGQVEDALVEAESLLIRNQAERKTISGQKTEVAKTLQEVWSDGALELRRAGTQLLPSLARAMMWWNPEAIHRACERSMQVGAEYSEGVTSPILQLRHRTSLCVASELVRASVRHARHLAEILVIPASENAEFQVPDQLGDTRSVATIPPTGNTFASAPSANTKRNDMPSAFVRCDHRQQSNSGGREPVNEGVWIVIVGHERWGGSTDGIVDSSAGGETSVWSSPVVPPRSNIDHVGWTERSSGVSGGGVVTRAAADAQGVAVRMICDALQLCTDTPLLLAQALAVVPDTIATFREKLDSEFKGATVHTPVSRNSGQNKEDADADSANITSIHSEGLHAIDIPMQKHRFVFTGVIEALVLARAFRATTGIVPDASGQTDGNTKCLTSALRQSASLSSLPVDRTATTSALSSPPRDLEAEKVIRSMAIYDATSAAVERQLEVLHREAFSTTRVTSYQRCPVEMQPSSKGGGTTCFTTVVTGKYCCGGDRLRRSPDFGSVGIEDYSGCVDRNIAGWSENRQSSVQKEEPIAGIESIITKFAIPFTWGSLALVQAFPAPEEAVRLDRLLCARIVHALPGYFSSLPPETGIRLVSPMLRWLEARDDGVRWISVKPLDARASLLVSIGVVLRRRRKHKSGAHALRSPHRSPPLHPLSCSDGNNPGTAEHLPTPPPNASAAYTGNITAMGGSTRNGVTDWGDTQQQQQQQNHTRQDTLAVVAAASAVVQVVTTMISDARIGTSLFSLACDISRNAIDLMSECKDIPLAPGKVGSEDTAGSSIELVEEGAFVSPLLRVVADHLLRHYPDTYKETVLDESDQYEKKKGFPLPSMAYGKEGVEIATNPLCRAPAEQQEGQPVDNGGDDSDECSTGKGKWDDWDDADSDDLENGNVAATTAVNPERGVKNAASAQEPHMTAGRSAAAVMSAAAAYSAKTSLARSPRHETRANSLVVTGATTSRLSSSRSIGSSNSGDGGSVSIFPRRREYAEKTVAAAELEASVDAKVTSQTQPFKHQAEESIPDDDGDLRSGADGPETDAGDTGGDRSSIRGGESTNCVPPALQCLLDNESSTRHRRALFRAWRDQ